MATVSRSELSASPTPSYEVPPGILAGPIVPTVLRLALPTTVVLVVTNRPLGPTLVDGKGMKICEFAGVMDVAERSGQRQSARDMPFETPPEVGNHCLFAELQRATRCLQVL